MPHQQLFLEKKKKPPPKKLAFITDNAYMTQSPKPKTQTPPPPQKKTGWSNIDATKNAIKAMQKNTYSNT